MSTKFNDMQISCTREYDDIWIWSSHSLFVSLSTGSLYYNTGGPLTMAQLEYNLPILILGSSPSAKTGNGASSTTNGPVPTVSTAQLSARYI